jgi:cell division protein FtsZ
MKNETTGAVTLEVLQTLCATLSSDAEVSVDIQDVENLIRNAKIAFATTGAGSGEKRLEDVAEDALRRLEERGLYGKMTGLIVFVRGDGNESMETLQAAIDRLSSICDDDATIIWGQAVDETLDYTARISVVTVA